MEAFLGTIMPVAFNFAPVGWALCDGQLMSISQNAALFSLLGTQYGGNGTTNFALPDLRGRVAVGQGQGPGMPPVQMGEMAGANYVSLTLNGAAGFTLTTANMPVHSHAATFTGSGATPLAAKFHVGTDGGSSPAPTEGGSIAAVKMSGPGVSASLYLPGVLRSTVALADSTITTTGTAGGITGGAVTVADSGGGQPVTIPVTVNGQVPVTQPYTGVNYIICTQGLFPSRP